MLPTPATWRWSSRNALMGARRPRERRWSATPSSSSDSGSRPSPGGRKGVANGAADRELAGPEAARVAEADLPPAVQGEPSALVVRLAHRVEQQHAGHPQVHEQEHVVLELPDEVLAAAAERHDAPALDGVAQRPRLERHAPPRVE